MNHIEGRDTEDRIVLTSYNKNNGGLDVIILNTNRIIRRWSHYGGRWIGSYGFRGKGQLTRDQFEDLEGTVPEIHGTEIKFAESGDYIITLSTKTDTNVYVITCSESGCPREICQLYDAVKEFPLGSRDPDRFICPIK